MAILVVRLVLVFILHECFYCELVYFIIVF